MTSLAGKTILLTGASSGIGHATATALIEQDAKVIGLCRNINALPQGLTPLQCDLSDPQQIHKAFQQLDHLDILINNAGLALLSPLSTGDPDDWQRMWQINVHALALCSQLALPLFPEKGENAQEGGGHILNVSSLSGHRVPPSGGFYAPTKFAVRALTDALRLELRAAGNPTRISSISPGFVDTPLLDHYFKGREEALAQTKANTQMLRAHDIAQSILHILTAPAGVEINDLPLRSSSQAL